MTGIFKRISFAAIFFASFLFASTTSFAGGSTLYSWNSTSSINNDQVVQPGTEDVAIFEFNLYAYGADIDVKNLELLYRSNSDKNELADIKLTVDGQVVSGPIDQAEGQSKFKFSDSFTVQSGKFTKVVVTADIKDSNYAAAGEQFKLYLRSLDANGSIWAKRSAATSGIITFADESNNVSANLAVDSAIGTFVNGNQRPLMTLILNNDGSSDASLESLKYKVLQKGEINFGAFRVFDANNEVIGSAYINADKELEFDISDFVLEAGNSTKITIKADINSSTDFSVLQMIFVSADFANEDTGAIFEYQGPEIYGNALHKA